IDAYGQDGDQWQYPHALSEREFIVTFLPLGRKKPTDRFEGRFSVFWMDADGRRELLASDPQMSSNQPVPLMPRPRPHTRPSSVDYRKDTGVFYLQDIYRGPGLAGVPRGVVKALRVVALDYRAAGIGRNGNWGALVSTPVAIGNGSWDVKTVLGSAPVYEDGSAMFTVPARTPIYFQALDASGHVVQTMRSWATLQPGEVSSCVGCHEAKSEPPTSYERGTIALRKGAQPLQPFYGGVDGDSTRNCRVGQLRNSTDRPAPGGSRLPSGAIPVQNSPAATASPGKTDCGVGQLRNSIPPAAQGFSFPQDIQPILARHCIRCHNDRTRKRPSATAQAADFDPESVVSLSPRESDWRYATQPPGADWAKPGFDDSKWPVGKAGFGRRGTPGGKHATDWLTPDIWLRRTFSMPAGGEAAKLFVDVCHDEDVEVYLNGVLAFRATGYITKYQTFAASAEAARALKPGENLLAVRCHQTTGGQFIDVALFAARQAEEKPSAQQTAFSLLGEPVTDAVAKRKWSDAYLALTGAVIAEKSKNEFYIADPRGALVNWVSAQSMPPMLPPYSAGAAKSGLLRMLKDGHQSVKLSREELDKLACWIDLLVPYCGDYAEAHAWTADEMAKYERFLAKRRAIEAVEARSIRELIHKQPEVGGETTLTIELTDASGAVVAKQDGRASPSKPLTFDLPRRFKAGDRIRVSGSQHLAVRLDPLLGETTVFAPDCSSVFATPLSELSCYPVGAFSGDRSRVTARPVALRELDAYRNLALNPYDVRGEAAAFPHAAANSECRNEPVFAARNAIDGHKQNQGHGKWPFQSWGPDKRADLWWQVDFGREVEMDKLVLTIRADFPHDKHWTKAAVVFSDGSRESIALQKTADPQTFRFKPRKARSVRLTDLVQDEPLGWCALVEVEVWGRDAIPVGADIARQPPK
ncbi:MAG: discoidin domain-containing protein, partial [Planctomycetes bacterium]|nr:discoidin domain-containing protein [Planctomycetota bacterium]